MAKIGPSEALMMNRHERRRLGKANGIKIPGIRKPINKQNETDTIQNKIQPTKEDILTERKVITEIFKENEKEL